MELKIARKMSKRKSTRITFRR